ncbi:MAG TPA: NUDIX hydrolase [Terriglobia bacterium]|nr:NUDIX hydrolase [Terriglobia bacterium]
MKREYPKQPIVGVGGVVVRGSCVLLVRRGTEPLRGEWSIPGGMLELGESLKDGVRREVEEEAGLRVRPMESIAVVDRVQKNGRRVRFHYVLIDYVCLPAGGRLSPGSDVLDARWVERKELPSYKLWPKTAAVIADAFEWVEKHERPRAGRAH